MFEIKLSPDLNWIFESINNGFYNTNHPINFNKLIFILENTTYYFIFNFLLLVFFLYLIFKITNVYFTFLLIFLLFVLNSFFYIQKDNIFLVAFGLYFIYVFSPKLINIKEEFIIFIIFFISFLTFPLFGLLLIFSFLVVCRRRAIYVVIFLVTSLSIYQWEPLKNQDSYSSYVKLNHVIASDSINIAKRLEDYSVLPSYFFIGEGVSLECVIKYNKSDNLINPFGVANIDYIINNKCINLNNKLSFTDYISVINNVYFLNFFDYSIIKLNHALQLLVRPYNNNIFLYIMKIFLGPIWLIILIIYLIYLRNTKYLIILFPVYIHIFFVIIFAPGYDIRYTYPEFISLVFLYLTFFKNEQKLKT